MPGFYTPVCVKHGLAMEKVKNGVAALEMRDKEKTEEYRIWSADLWKCPNPECDVEVLNGFSDTACYPGDLRYEDYKKEVTVVFY